jgi:hypothetical protein
VDIATELYAVVVVDCCSDARWYLRRRDSRLGMTVNSEQG